MSRTDNQPGPPPSSPMTAQGLTRSSRRRSRAGKNALLLATALFVCGAVAVIVSWRRHAWDQHVRTEIAAARRERDAGRIATASDRLRRLESTRPDVLLEQGLCEQARGRLDAALAAWERIPAYAPEFAIAAQLRAQGLLALGRFAPAEALLDQALARVPPGIDRFILHDLLARLLQGQGRFDEARRGYLAAVADVPDLLVFLGRLHQIETRANGIDETAAYLESAGRQAPDDDRVWLGRANLAIRLGRFDEAARWLDRCSTRRVGDPAVARARLELARAADRPDWIAPDLDRLPADPVLGFELRAWLARKAGDTAAERAALIRLLEAAPGHAPALVRLADLAALENRADELQHFRQAKAALDAARMRYDDLMASDNRADHARELAGLAEALGDPFEAQTWRAVAEPARPRPKPPVLPSGTLADIVGALPTFTKPSVASVSPPAVRFTDDAEAVGLDFRHDNGDPGKSMVPPVTFSGGVALFDYDDDGWLDVYCVQGGRFPPEPDQPGGDRLFHNRGDGTFEDVSASAGIASLVRGYGHGVTVGDYDNDGRPDLFLTRWRSYVLLRNRGDGTFEDTTGAAGFDGDRDWPTSAAFADLDDDGDLDLYVCHYLQWDQDSTFACVDPNDPTKYRCMPRDFPALPDHVFRNDDGRFIDVTQSAGFTDVDGRGLGVLAADVDGDGKVDLFVANDTTANYLFKNRGGFRFEEAAQSAGVAANASGGFQAGMGVACGDLDGDGLLDLSVTNFYLESTSFFRNLGNGFFADDTAAIGLAAPSRYLLGFGVAFFDADNDGRLDLVTANGHVFDGRPRSPWRMPIQLLLGGSDGRLHDVSAQAGAPFLVPRMGRGLAVGDLDNDGATDVVVIDQGGPLVYLHNRSEVPESISLALEGATSNRSAIGAAVTARIGAAARVRPLLGGASYQSASDPRVVIGLGSAPRADELEVRWPSGRVDRFGPVGPGRYALREGSGSLAPLAH